MKKLFPLPLLLLLAIPALAQTPVPNQEKVDNIRRLMAITGAEKIQGAMFEQMMSVLKPLLTSTMQGDPSGQKVMNRFEQLMSEEFKKMDLLALTVQLYDKHFTNEDIKGLIQFYESPVGKKAIEVLPALAQESMARGMELGQGAGQKALERLITEFPELQPASTRPAAKD